MKFDYILTPSELRDAVDDTLLIDHGQVLELSDEYERDTGDTLNGNFTDAAAKLLDWICNTWDYNDVIKALENTADLHIVEYVANVTPTAGDPERVELTYTCATPTAAGALGSWARMIKSNAGTGYDLRHDGRRITLTPKKEYKNVITKIKEIEYIATTIL